MLSGRNIVILIGLLTSFSFLAMPCQAQIFQQTLQKALNYEQRGDLKSAGMTYFSILNNQLGTTSEFVPSGAPYYMAPQELKIAVGRRAVACLTQSANEHFRVKGLGTVGVPGMSNEDWNILMQTYVSMQRLEPNDPLWYYLEAIGMCGQGRYVEANARLKKAIKTTGGDPAVRQKANALLGHIVTYVAADQAKLDAMDRAAAQFLASPQGKAMIGGMMSGAMTGFGLFGGGGGGGGGGGSDNTPDWEKKAKNAEAHGDYNAANSFRAGNASYETYSKY